MNHLIKKFKVAGAGGGSKPKPQPATLLPPELGVHQLASSYSYAEILDLISDGPIAGLVNQNNSRVNGLSSLQGIYLDDVPIAVTDDGSAGERRPTIIASETTDIASYFSQLGNAISSSSLPSNPFSTYVGNFKVYQNLENHPPITNLSSSSSVRHFITNPEVNYGMDFFSPPPSWNNRRYSTTGFYTAPAGFLTSDGSSKIEFICPNELFYYVNNPRELSDYKIANTFQNIYSRKGGYAWSKIRNNSFGSEYLRNYVDALFFEKPPEMNREDYVNNQILDIMGISTPDIQEDIQEARLAKFLEQDSGNLACFYVDASIIEFSNADENTFLDSNGQVRTDLRLDIDTISRNRMQSLNYSYPVLDPNGKWNGKMEGFILFFVGVQHFKVKTGETDYPLTYPFPYRWYNSIWLEGSHVQSLVDTISFVIIENIGSYAQKYNYTNILSEIKTGEEKQTPFRYFNNVYIDKTYDSRLLGPFRAFGEVQTLFSEVNENQALAQKVMTNNFEFNNPVGKQKGLPINEGSNDQRKRNANDFPNYAAWDKNLLSYDEEPISATHFVENPNVESVIVSLSIDALNDTASVDIPKGGANPKKVDAGSRFPGVLNIEVEVGKVNEKGVRTTHYKKRYQIIALVESPTIIDIGNPDSKVFEENAYKFIKDLDRDAIESGIFNSLKLPSAFDVSGQEETPTRRYVKVTKLSTETNSILVQKAVSLSKVTEVIPVNFSYPFSSIIGTKLDARTFSTIPTRTFDARLKLIKIPSNYYPVKDNVLETDKRYYTSVVDHENATTEDKSVYKGDWDGTFKIGWTDNPAWVLYDLLTNNRYGLGQYIGEDDINKWDLYKIARFCDAVDEEGLFVGVPDGRGGLEPRYSCNIMFTEGTKVFDSINQIANLFRGSVFYNNKEINFLDDRLREPTALFSNSNVKDGLFSYTNYRRDEQFNAVEVIYIDRFDNFKTKVEYVEDEEDILQRGMFKKQVNAYGVTSKAMANRIARHLIYQTIKENQSVSFIGGNEVLLCKPGDLIIIEDELKSLKSNFGRVLDVDSSAKTIRIDESFVTGEYTSGITLYSPTGQSASEDIDVIATAFRERLTGFSITGNAGGVLDDFTGIYKFSGYTDGFNDRINEGLSEQFALYTGNRTPQNIIYYSTLATGWVFATGSAFANNNLYDKIIGETGSKSISSLSTGGFDQYDSATAGYRVIGGSGFSGDFDNSNGDISRTTQGALESEISLVTTPQIITLSITGAVNQDYGSLLYVDSGDINANLLSFVADGSAYRIQRQNSDDQIYKILEMREEAPNEYSVVATKYDSGKFNLIENSVSVEFQSDTFGYSSNIQINESNYITLDDPVINSVITGSGLYQNYYISGNWQAVSNATGYNIIHRQPSLNESSVNTSETGFSFGELEVGNHTFSVKALGDNSKNAATRYYNSNYTTSGISFLPTASPLYTLDTTILSNITAK